MQYLLYLYSVSAVYFLSVDWSLKAAMHTLLVKQYSCAQNWLQKVQHWPQKAQKWPQIKRGGGGITI